MQDEGFSVSPDGAALVARAEYLATFQSYLLRIASRLKLLHKAFDVALVKDILQSMIHHNNKHTGQIV